ncbi:MAG: type IV secretion system protein [Rhodospirillaceae bacterium]|nr:type IV secretion system protein [Rhodospirillaceae bacterium]
MTRCQPLIFDGTSSIADLLGAVDCTAQQTTHQAFDRLFGAQSLLSSVLTAVLTLYVAIIAVRLLTGRTTLGIATLTPRMMVLGLVLTFATSWTAYQQVVWNLLSAAPDYIASMVMGSRGSATIALAHELDGLFASISELGIAAQQSAQGQAGQGASFALAKPAELLSASALMLLLSTVGVLVVSRIVLAALLALGPAFILLALFRGTRGLFEGWLKGAVLFCIIPLLTTLVGGSALIMLRPFMDSVDVMGGAPSLQTAISIFVGASVYVAVMLMILKVATALTSGWKLPLEFTSPIQSNALAATMPTAFMQQNAAFNAPQSLHHLRGYGAVTAQVANTTSVTESIRGPQYAGRIHPVLAHTITTPSRPKLFQSESTPVLKPKVVPFRSTEKTP